MTANDLIEKTFELPHLPLVGKQVINGQLLYVQATGVRLRLEKFSNYTYYLDFDKKYFIAKDGKGNVLNCKII